MPILIIACCLVGISLSASNSTAARDLGPLMDAPEWPRLVTLWHAMLDHSSDLIYSRARFDELVEDLDQADADISALAQRHLLSDQPARDLRRLFHARYRYISEHHYTTQRRIEITETESARGAAEWVVELQLALLRTTYPDPDRNRKLISAAESNLSYQLTFLYHLDKFEAEADRRRANLKAREDEGKTVDWQAFDTDCARRYRLLLDAYRARRIPSAPAVRELLRYICALTQSRPPPPAATSDLPETDL
ncbi:MAG: hypothetical protein JSV79_00575 [Armatimonadota bacterium]|nr:MAG: hypothetical protein JSV79_00575 [Armatimonadota bacterium]